MIIANIHGEQVSITVDNKGFDKSDVRVVINDDFRILASKEQAEELYMRLGEFLYSEEIMKEAV